MANFIPKRLFSHGGSQSVDLPASWLKKFSGKYLELELREDCIIIHPPKDELTAIEADPSFEKFIQSLFADALENPEKLKDTQAVWDADWEDLLEGIQDEDD